MLSKTALRRLVAAVFVACALTSAAPAAALASNGGGGPRPVQQIR